VVFARKFYLAETLSYNRNLRFIQRENRVFLVNEFLMQGDRGKSEIKITGVIIMNLEIFDENFIIFG
jgi:hypothetical protein